MMSTEQAENTPWTKLKTLLDQASPDLIDSIKADFGQEHVCIVTYSKAIFEGGKNKSKLQGEKTPEEFMKELGFTDEDLEKNRMCIISDCEFQNELCNLLNHMIGYHKMPIKNIASIIPAMARDDRVAKKGVQGFIARAKHSGKGTD